jgi:hypothetical protein
MNKKCQVGQTQNHTTTITIIPKRMLMPAAEPETGALSERRSLRQCGQTRVKSSKSSRLQKRHIMPISNTPVLPIMTHNT